MSHAEQLERETEATREQIANTLDELRARMTPGYVLDQLADRVGVGAAAAFARNLRDQAVNNPLPVALIGTGLTWLMLGPHRTSAGGPAGEATDMASGVTQGAVEEAVEGLGATTASAGPTAAQAVTGTTEAAQQAAEQAGDAIRAGAGAVAATMQRTAAATKAAGRQTLHSGGAVVDFCREQPLLLAGIGIAMGAMIGALLPATDAENRLMGETSDRVKERAQDLAARQAEAAKEGVQEGVTDRAAQVAERPPDAAHEHAGRQAGREDQAAEGTDDAKAGTEAKADEPTLAPSGPDEARGQPWPAENAPL